MKKGSGKTNYILTWVAATLMLVTGILLMALSWNSSMGALASRSLLVITWVVLCASGIYLFLQAAGHAHRQWINDQTESRETNDRIQENAKTRKGAKREDHLLDFTSVARKLVRRVPENTSLAELGPLILKNLARELEIMSGLFYLEKEGRFEISSSYAVQPTEDSYTFGPGEGLTGQVVRNGQLMVLTRLPEGYRKTISGLGQAPPAYLAMVPLLHHQRTVALIECAGYRYDPHDIENMFRIFSRDLMEKISPHLII